MSDAAVERYFDHLEALLGHARAQATAIAQAAALVADGVRNEGVVHTFGTGHSHLLAEEVFYRAGGLVPINPIQDTRISLSAGALASTRAERTAGLAAEILDGCTISPHDVAIVISNSGRNAAPVEAAHWFGKHGVPVIALTSLRHSESISPRNSLGARLFEIADVVLDNGGVPGDAAVEVPGVSNPMGPTSTSIGSVLLHAVCIGAAELLSGQGTPPTVFLSANADGPATEAVIRAVEAVRPRIPCL